MKYISDMLTRYAEIMFLIIYLKISVCLLQKVDGKYKSKKENTCDNRVDFCNAVAGKNVSIETMITICMYELELKVFRKFMNSKF